MSDMTERAKLIAAIVDSGNCSCGRPWHECEFALYSAALSEADRELAEAYIEIARLHLLQCDAVHTTLAQQEQKLSEQAAAIRELELRIENTDMEDH
jgi:hypothetical protein